MARVWCDLHNDAADQRLDLFQINLCGVTPAMAATAPPWWLVAREAQPRPENLIPNMILQNRRSSSSCKKRLRNCPQLQKEDWCYDGRFLRSARVKLLILHPIYLKHPVDMATALLLHCCCCTSIIIQYLQISVCPQNVKWFPGLITLLRAGSPCV